MDEIIINSIDDFSNALIYMNHQSMQLMQLEKGKFSACLRYKNLNYFCKLFHFITYSQFETKGISTKQFYTFYTTINNDSNILNNIKITSDMLIIIPPDFKFHFFLKDTFSSAYAIQIEKNIIEERLGKLDYQAIAVYDKNILDDLKNILVFMFTLNKLDSIEVDRYLLIFLEKLQKIKLNLPSVENIKILLFIKIINYMDENYKDDLSIKNIANHFAISSRTMSNLFNDMIGHSPKKYLIANKLNKFKMSIKNNDNSLSISKLMINNNLEFQSQVSKDFKKLFNKTPLEYKKSLFISNKNN